MKIVPGDLVVLRTNKLSSQMFYDCGTSDTSETRHPGCLMPEVPALVIATFECEGIRWFDETQDKRFNDCLLLVPGQLVPLGWVFETDLELCSRFGKQ
jgi:hypothetical protein